MQDLNNGINLGGWLSQFKKADPRHFATFITENDIQQIASWGFDHCRLPVDYTIFEDDDRPFFYKEEGLSFIDLAIQWAKNAGIGLVLDLHHAPGFTFSRPDETTLFNDVAMQERFIEIWRMFARRYAGEGEYLAFDLLNEVVTLDSGPWNSLAHRTIEAIRGVDAQRRVIIGGTNYNSVFTLDGIAVVDDPNVLYTFHFYEPHLFTHQKARWIPAIVAYDQTLHYPGEFNGLGEFLKGYRPAEGKDPGNITMERYLNETLDRELMKKDLQPAVAFLKKSQRPLYCGEYGVIHGTPLASSVRWVTDLLDEFDALGIGRAYWSYKGMSFGLVDLNGQVISEALLRAVSRK